MTTPMNESLNVDLETKLEALEDNRPVGHKLDDGRALTDVVRKLVLTRFFDKNKLDRSLANTGQRPML